MINFFMKFLVYIKYVNQIVLKNSFFYQYMSNKEKNKYVDLKIIELKNNKKSHQLS
jgi:hypothetical protein